MKNIIDSKHLEKAMSYATFRKLADDLVKAGKVTGTQQSPELTQYAMLHCHRMDRLDSTIKLLPETVDIVNRIELPQTWLVITESWCGDAAQIVPYLNAFTKLNDKIDLKIVLREENLELMDMYLTNGKSRSIPKLVVTTSNDLQELFHWGPRPAVLQEIMNQWVADEWSFEEMKEELHLWYAKDNGAAIQKELRELIAASLHD